MRVKALKMFVHVAHNVTTVCAGFFFKQKTIIYLSAITFVLECSLERAEDPATQNRQRLILPYSINK